MKRCDLHGTVPKSASIHDQFDRALRSVPLNIAEGSGKHTSAGRFRLFDTARGSALECAACLDVFLAKKKGDSQYADEGNAVPLEIVSELIRAIPLRNGLSCPRQTVIEPTALLLVA